MNFRQVVREPLLHFLLIGLALFLLYGVVSPGDFGGQTITVSQGDVAELRRQYAALWGRPPTDQELAGLIDGRVRDEIRQVFQAYAAGRRDQAANVIS